MEEKICVDCGLPLKWKRKQIEEALEFYRLSDNGKTLGDYQQNYLKLLNENKELKEKWDRIVEQSDYAEWNQCGICNDDITRKTGEHEAICVKTARLTHICLECEEKFEKLEKERNEIKKFYEELLDQWKEEVKSNRKNKQKLEKVSKFIQKLDDMNPEDFVHYAKTEIRIFKKEILGEKK